MLGRWGRVAGMLLAVVVLGGPGATAPGAAATIDRVIARVNGEIVTESDLAKDMAERGESTVSTGKYMQQYLDRKLLQQAASRQNVQVPETELQSRVEEMVKEVRAQFPTDRAFRDALTGDGLTIEKLKENLLRRAKTDYLVYRAIDGSIPVASSGEVARFEAERRAQGKSAYSIHLRRLGVAVGKKGAPAAVAEAESLVAKFREMGLSFDEGVRQFSKVPGAKEDGGDLGWREPEQLAPAVAAATATLSAGQATPGIVAGGYANVFYVEGKREAKSTMLEARFEERRKQLLEKLRREAQIEVYDDSLRGALVGSYEARVTGAMVGSAGGGPAKPVSEEIGRQKVTTSVPGSAVGGKGRTGSSGAGGAGLASGGAGTPGAAASERGSLVAVTPNPNDRQAQAPGGPTAAAAAPLQAAAGTVNPPVPPPATPTPRRSFKSLFGRGGGEKVGN